MARKLSKIVLHFDDGSTYTVEPGNGKSIFTSEARAQRCGYEPPYGKPPEEGAAESTTRNSGDACFWLDGVLVCD